MANIRIPTYERQVEGPQQKASQAQAPEPLRQAYGENVAQATGNLGKAMMQLGDDIIKINAQINKDNLLLQTSKMNDQFKVFHQEMKQRDDFYNFDSDTDKKIDEQLTQLKENLGNDRLFDKWYAVEGQAYVNAMKTQTQMLKIPAQYRYNKNNLAQLAQQMSYDTAMGEEGARQELYVAVDSNKVLSSQDKDNLKYEFEISYAKNEIESIIEQKPQTVIDNINNNKYVYDIGGTKGDSLSPQEKAYYLRRAENIKKSKENTVLQEGMESALDYFNSMPIFEKNRFYKQVVEEKEKTGKSVLNNMFPNLTNKQERQLFNYMGSYINDNANGFNGLGSYIVQQNEQAYKQVFDTKGNFQKDIPFANAVGLYRELSSTILNEDMNLSPEKLEKLKKMQRVTLSNIGKNVLSNDIDTPKDFSSHFWQENTNYETTKNMLRETLEKEGFVNYFGALEETEMTPEDVGAIYSGIFLAIDNAGINPKDNNNKEQISKIIANEIRDYYAMKLGWSKEQANAFLINKKLVKYSNNANKDDADLILEGY